MMRRRQPIYQIWKRLSINSKFGLAFSVLIGINLIMIAASLITLRIIRVETETAVLQSAVIQRHVLDMDRGLERARRLEMQFFLRYPTLGYSEAYEQYALPAAEQVAQVAATNTQLEKLISESEMADIWQENKVNFNLYFLAINRHIASVEEVTQLIAQQAADETGMIPQLHQNELQLLAIIETANEPDLMILFREMQSFQQEYIIKRQRSLMQSAFNLADLLRESLEISPTLRVDQRTQSLQYLDAYLAAANEILDVDVAILSRFNEFDLQAAAIDPITTQMIFLANEELEHAQEQIMQTGQLANVVLFTIAILGLGIAVSISLALNKSITRNIINLTEVASKFDAGSLNTRAQLDSGDELGRLAATYNSMADRLGLLVGDLEGQVEERTTEIASVNQKLLKEIDERKKAEEIIRNHSLELEERVAERTQQLVEAQERSIRQERLAVLGQLAGSVGHELRNPLGVISNTVYYLDMIVPDTDEKTREGIELIHNNTQEAARIVTDLLDFSRVKTAERTAVNVSENVEVVITQHPAPEIVTISMDIPDDLPPAHVDNLQIRQVLSNLVTNAYQAMPDGGKLTVTARMAQGDIKISISDTGIGISPENMDKIFEPLFTTKAKGVGLGLAICKNLAEANGGHIEVESQPGKGTQFSLFLPVGEDES